MSVKFVCILTSFIINELVIEFEDGVKEATIVAT